MRGRRSGRLGSRVEYTIQARKSVVKGRGVEMGGRRTRRNGSRVDDTILDRDRVGQGIRRGRVQSGMCAWMRREFCPWPAGRCEGGGSGGGKEMRGRRSGGLGSSGGTRYKPARR